MELDLDLVRTTGRAPTLITATVVRELAAEDLELLSIEKGSKPSALKRISDRHHALARAIASGMPDYEAAAVTGYDISRISILKSDPAFEELLSFYRAEKDRAFRSVQDKLAGIASDALDELQTRVEDTPEKLSVNQLMQLVQLGADRSGNGPSSTTNTNVTVGAADRLEAARARVAERRMKTIDTQPTEQ